MRPGGRTARTSRPPPRRTGAARRAGGGRRCGPERGARAPPPPRRRPGASGPGPGSTRPNLPVAPLRSAAIAATSRWGVVRAPALVAALVAATACSGGGGGDGGRAGGAASVAPGRPGEVRVGVGEDIWPLTGQGPTSRHFAAGE